MSKVKVNRIRNERRTGVNRIPITLMNWRGNPIKLKWCLRQVSNNKLIKKTRSKSLGHTHREYYKHVFGSVYIGLIL